MPKVVDHERYRREIVEKAVPVFSLHGYSGLGMREIAKELGISKSGLYHYFASKEALFAACTEFVVERDSALAAMTDGGGTVEKKAFTLIGVFKEIEKDFQGEAYLLLDYLRGKSPREVARDQNMKLANKKYLTMITQIVGEEAAASILALMLGGLLQRLFDGRKTPLADIELWFADVLSNQK